MKSLGTFLFTGILLISGFSAVQAQPRLEIEIKEQKINMTVAEKTGADIVYTPGDTIEYQVIARNSGDTEMTDPTIIDPIPQGVEYITGSAKGENCRILFSVDNGLKYSVWPVMITATTPNGTKIEREATKDEVTHIKWLVREPIPAGGQKILSFRVKLK